MKCVLLIVLLSTVCLAQTESRPKLKNEIIVTKPIIAAAQQDAEVISRAEPVNSNPWNLIGDSLSPKKRIYYRDGIKTRYGRAETWLKFVMLSPLKMPKKAAALNRTAYYLQYATADCEGERLTLESAIFYDRANRQIEFAYNFFMTTFAEPVLPGSVGEMIWYKLCEDDDEPAPSAHKPNFENRTASPGSRMVPPPSPPPAAAIKPEPPVSATPVGETREVRIISKPRPGYTDAARQANIQGTVVLSVTFWASGQVGSIVPVKALPHGLTQQAIAAARRISFEPAKINGVPHSVKKDVEYPFSIY